MTDPLRPVAVIDGHTGRRVNNALTISFREGDSEPFAKAQQGAGDGFGGKLGILFGFRNGSPGNHELTYADGSKLLIPTRETKPTLLTRGDGTAVATITRGATSSATLPDGSELFAFLPHPTEPISSERMRIVVNEPGGERVADLDVIRTSAGWTIDAEDVLDLLSGDFGGDVGGSLPIPFPGTRLVLYRDLSPVERDVLLAACCEIALGVRPYFEGM